MSGKAQRVARPTQTRLQNSEGCWTKVHQSFNPREVVGGVNVLIRVANFQSAVE